MSQVTQDVVTKHWNERARSYQFNMKRDFFAHGVDDRWRQILADALGDAGRLKVLDAGCGPAVMTKLLLDLGHEVTGVDTSQEMLQYGQEMLGDATERVHFQQGSVDDLPFEDETFDLIISRYVVWTLPDPVKALAEWQRLLKPGGRVLVIDGNWYYHYYHSYAYRLWYALNTLSYKVRSGFDPSQKLATSYASDLPTTKLLRPDWDLGMLAGLGFTNMQVFRNLERKIWGSLSWQRWKSPWNHIFLLVATKGSDAKILRNPREAHSA